jgi:Mrp family chromosome partitioning ATPase
MTKADPVRLASPVRSLVFGLLIGIVLAIAAALLLDALSNTVRTREDARIHSGADVLAAVPEDVDWDDVDAARLVTDVDPLSPVAEAFRTLRQNLRTATADLDGPVSILVTSALAGEGKTTTSANLAVAFADTGHTVVAVDADLRAPRLHRFLGGNEAPGLSEVLTSEREAGDSVQWLRPRLGLLAAGAGVERPDRAVLQADVPMLLSTLTALTGSTPRRRRGGAEVNGDGSHRHGTSGTVLLDAPPILQAAEVSSLAACVDGVILILRSGVTSREATANAAEQVRRAGGRLLGVVLVGVRAEGGGGAGRPYVRSSSRAARATPGPVTERV